MVFFPLERSPPPSVKELATSESWLFLVAGSERGSLFPLLFFGVKKDQESSIVVWRAFEEGATTVRWGAALYRVRLCRFGRVTGRAEGRLRWAGCG